MRYSLDEALLKDVLSYLSNRPYKESNVLIGSIQRDAMIIVEEAPKVEVPKPPAKKE